MLNQNVFLNRKVKQVRSHLGVQLKGGVHNSIDAEKHKVEMIYLPNGSVGIRQGNGEADMAVGSANVHSVYFYPEESPTKEEKPAPRK